MRKRRIRANRKALRLARALVALEELAGEKRGPLPRAGVRVSLGAARG